MDAHLIVILIVLAVIFLIGLFLVLEYMESCFLPPLPRNSSSSLPYIVGNHFAELTDDIEGGYGEMEKERKVTPLGGIFSHLQRGSQTLHAQGLCNHGGGAWGNSMSVSGRAATTGNWSPVSGGIYDCCQCEDNGGFH